MPKATKLRKKLNEKDVYQSLVNLKEALTETTDGVKGKAGEIVSDLLENLQTTANDYQHEAEEYISDKPLVSVGLALGLGLLLGKFVL